MARGSFVAGEDIIPCRFVKLSTVSGATGKVLMAGAADTPAGVSMQGVRNLPGFPGLDDNLAAKVNENVRVYVSDDPEDEPYIEVDAAYVQGTYLKPSTNGIATTATGDGDIYGAIQLEQSTVANQIVRCRVIAPQFRGA